MWKIIPYLVLFFKASVRELYFLPLLWKLSQQEKHFCFFAHRIQIVTHQLRFMLTHSCTVRKILTDFVMKAKWAVATVKNAVLTIQLHSVSLLWLSEEWLPCSHMCVPELWPIPLVGVPSCKMSMFWRTPFSTCSFLIINLCCQGV